MYAKLGLIALSCFAVSAICLGGAFALGGDRLSNVAFNFGDFDRPVCDFSGAQPTASSRTLAWDGDGSRAAVSLPADAVWQAGQGDQLVVTGDPRIVAHVQVRNGVVAMDCRTNNLFENMPRVAVTLPGRRTFQAFGVSGSGHMRLAGISQPDLTLNVSGSGHIDADAKTQKTDMSVSGSGSVNAKLQTSDLHMNVSGSGDVAASGQADMLHAHVSGSGEVHAGDIATRTANLGISGSGKIETAALESVNVDISGAGKVYLKNEPKSLDADFSGAGKVVHPDGREEGRRHREHHDS